MSTATKTARLDTTIETFFETKTAGDVAGTVAFFSPDLVSCIDAAGHTEPEVIKVAHTTCL